MGSPWPAPEPDDRRERGPNYALRRAMVIVVVLALVGVGGAWWLGRDSDDDLGGDGTAKDWNTVALQDADSGEITLVDADGEETESFSTDLIGLLDVGVSDRLVVGVAGQPSTDGLGIIDLDSGDVAELEVEGDGVSRLDDSPYLLVFGGPRDPLSLVDVGAAEVIDLVGLADTNDPIVTPSLVRIDAAHAHVAFTELGELETVLVDLETQQSVSLAGSLVDIGAEGVLTLTNRGRTTLVDLYGFDGERIGTVETDAAAGGLLVDDRTALIVTRSGGLVRVNFDDEEVDEVGSIAQQLSGGAPDDDATSNSDETDTDTDDQFDLVRTVLVVADRTRLVVLGEGAMAITDLDGQVLAADRVADAGPPITLTSADTCVLIGTFGQESTLWDTIDGTRLETFDPGVMLGRSADGCTVTFEEQSTSTSADTPTSTRLVGPDLDRTAEGRLGTVARDGSAAIGLDDDGGYVLDAATGDRLDVPTETLFGLFLDR